MEWRIWVELMVNFGEEEEELFGYIEIGRKERELEMVEVKKGGGESGAGGGGEGAGGG